MDKPGKTPSRVLVTGSAGFIGSHLNEALGTLGCMVEGLDNFDPLYPRTDKLANIRAASESDYYHFTEGSILDSEALLQTTSRGKPEAIVHLAAKAGVRPSIMDPQGYSKANIDGTISVLEFARRQDISHVVFASSSSVYGTDAKVPFREDGITDRPVSPYAATKKAGELLCHTYHSLYGLQVTILRFFTVYGPRQRPDLAIRKFADLITDGKPVPFFGDGTTARDYTYVSDTVAGICRALSSKRALATYNLGNSYPVSLSEMVAVLSKALGRTAELDQKPVQPGDVPITFADITRAREELGYDPKVPFMAGIMEFTKWLNARDSLLRWDHLTRQ
jgi:UDP-glucuronate 4-epimerase